MMAPDFEPRISNLETYRRPRGSIAVVAIVCLALIALLCAGLLRVAAARREQGRIDERALQADWLAESGVERAAARLAAAPDYRGETWTIAADELGGSRSALVRIRVEPVPDQPDRRRVRVQAEYPGDAPRRARRTKEITLSLSPEARGDGR